MRNTLLTLGLIAGMYMAADAQSLPVADSTNTETLEGITVYKKQEGHNVTLMGVDEKYLDYRRNDGSTFTLHTKGLLFKLEDGEMTRLIGNIGSYYVGQKYDIEYNLFTETQKVSPSFVRDVFSNAEYPRSLVQELNGNISGKGGDFDGVLRSCEFKTRKN